MAAMPAYLQPDPSAFAGRKVGAVTGSFIATLAEQGNAIILCGTCRPKFNPKPYHYFEEKKQPVNGQCDACRSVGVQRTMFLPEHLLGVTWTPR